MHKYLASSLTCIFIAAACGGTVTTVGDSGTDGSSGDGSGNDGFASDGPVGDSGGGACDGGACQAPLHCCTGQCVYEQNDPLNCGACGTHCGGAASMCENGNCVSPTCNPGCTSGQVCCDIPGPGPSQPPKCVDGDTCPIGCPLCN